jgi:mRNA interferase ChpB
MVRRTAFERGDIIRVCLNPTSGQELQGDFRPALVLSPKTFNQFGMTLIAPITQGGDFSRFAGFAVTLSGAGTNTQGVILVNMMRMMDVTARKAEKIEAAPASIVEEALMRLEAILER